MKSLRIILVLLGCLHLCGGNYGVLQAIAWGTMLVNYSSAEGLAQGVANTFDGEHPCDLCSSITQSKQDQNSDSGPLKKSLERLELKSFFLAGICAAAKPILQNLPELSSAAEAISIVARRDSPATPPPRFA